MHCSRYDLRRAASFFCTHYCPSNGRLFTIGQYCVIEISECGGTVFGHARRAYEHFFPTSKRRLGFLFSHVLVTFDIHLLYLEFHLEQLTSRA